MTSSRSGPRPRVRRRSGLAGALGPVLLLAGCATPPGTWPVVVDSPHPSRLGRVVDVPERLVAVDLVNALMQVESLRLDERSVRLSADPDPFLDALSRALHGRGVAVEDGAGDAGIRVLMANVMYVPDDPTRTERVYTVALDRVALRRHYRIDGDVVAPVSSLYVRGESPGAIRLDDRLFVEP